LPQGFPIRSPLPSAAAPKPPRREHPTAALRRDEVAVLQFFQEVRRGRDDRELRTRLRAREGEATIRSPASPATRTSIGGHMKYIAVLALVSGFILPSPEARADWYVGGGLGYTLVNSTSGALGTLDVDVDVLSASVAYTF
jgi:hypothetical protein